MREREKKAINALEVHKKNLEKIKTLNDGYLWTTQLTDIVGKYLGKETNLYKTSFQFSFSNEYYNESGNSRAGKLVDNCIEFISNNDVKQEFQGNILSKMTDQAVIALIFGIISLVGGIGYFCGDWFAKNKIDEEKIELRHKIDSLNNFILLRESTPSFEHSKIDSVKLNSK